MQLVIYGAQAIAFGLHEAYTVLCPRISIGCFLVTQRGINASILAGIPVVELASYATSLSLEEKEKVYVLIATPENVQTEIEESLEVNGFFHYHRVTAEEYAAVMEKYYAKKEKFLLLSPLPKGKRKSFANCLVALSEVDKPLRSSVTYENWMEPVQVGTSLGAHVIANLHDNMGDNISHKNRNYSELTALYWLWKNRLQSEKGRHMYYGLMQYRRRLQITDEDLLRLEFNNVDAVLPYPMIYEPDISAHPKRYLKEVDWQALLTALEDLQPAYARAFPDVLSQPYFYNYNIILARKPVLTDYCSWLFPVLARVEELSVPRGRERADRYIGYMGEVLETLYFMYNKDDLHIVHTGCKFLV